MDDKPDRRQRKKTARGAEYRLDLLKNQYRRLRRAWRIALNSLASLIITERNSEVLENHCLQLNTKMSALAQAHEELEKALESEEERNAIYEEFDAIANENLELLKMVKERLQDLEEKESSVASSASRSSRSSRLSSYKSSNAPSSKRYPKSKKTLRCKVNSFDSVSEPLPTEDCSKEILRRYLNQVKNFTQKDDSDIDEEDQFPRRQRFKMPDQLEDSSPRLPSFKFPHRNSTTNVERENSPSYKSSKHQPSSSESSTSDDVSPSTRVSLVESKLVDIVKTLVDNQRHFNLPSPEPEIFCGDFLQFPTWIQAFETLIERKTTKPSEKIHYLRKYVSGEAKEAIDGLLILNSSDAYEMAKKVLVKRFGDPFAVANAYRQKLESWPKIPNGDAKALRKFADFLVHCEKAMAGTSSLAVLNDDLENRKLAAKLPRWLVGRWTREAYQFKEENEIFPPFEKFVKFVTKESDIANDPVFSTQISPEAQPGKKPKEPSKAYKTASTFSTSTDNKNDKSLSSATTDIKNTQQTCLFCQSSSHELERCEEFLKKTIDERKKYALNNSLCFGCLNQGHRSKACQQRKTCNVCKRQHPTPLHGDVKEKSKDVEAAKNSVPQATSNCTKMTASTFCKATYSMIVPVWISHADNPQLKKLVYALLDDQSDTTFVTDKVLEDLGVRGAKTRLSLSTLHAENKIVDTRKAKGLLLQDFKRQVSITLPRSFTRSSIPVQRSQIPTPESAKLWAHTQPIAKELMPYSEDIDVGVLVGLDCTRALIPREVIPGDDGTPYALRTDLGWGLVGRYSNDTNEHLEEDEIGVSHKVLSCEVKDPPALCHLACRTAIKETIDPQQVHKMFSLDFSEVNCVNQESLSFDERRFLQKLQDGIVQTDDGHYQMPLPFNEESPNLPNNRVLASHRLKRLKSRLSQDPEYHRLYTKSMEDVIDKGFAEKVPDSQTTTEAGRVWYIPHHGVFHPKKPGKLRVVYDCSAKYKGESLNKHLLAGPDLTNNLVGVLCRFRQEPYAFMGDIEGMFHQFKVQENHRDFLRFLWWNNGNLQVPPSEYRMTVHLFGAKSSPGCANYGLKRIANDYENELGTDVAQFIRNDFYVDDGLKSLSTEDEAIHMIQRSQEMCARGGLRLHKLTSNSKKVIESIPPEDRAQDLIEIDLQKTKLPVERALGVQWSIESDVFQFNINVASKPYTRRGILSTVSSIYDPLGFIAPVILSGKRILQILTKDNYDWDEPVPEETKVQWERWFTSLPSLENLRVPRCYKPSDFGAIKTVEIHHFSDASCYGYGQCSYFRLINNQDQVHCSFALGKARVAPLKPITIPRLELTAALLSTKISSSLKRELDLTKTKETFWTDSQVVLGYLNNDARRFHVFVANRVQQIRDYCNPEQWRYVKSSDNPADIASRGISADKLQESPWLLGPSFLWRREIPEPNEEGCSHLLANEDPEVKEARTFATTVPDVKMATILQRLEYFSDWSRAKRAISLCLKFTRKLRNKSHSPQQLVVNDLSEVEEIIIKLTQEDAFPEEKRILQQISAISHNDLIKKRSIAKKSSLYRLDPFIDERGIMRVGGRIRYSGLSYEVKHPAILPRKGHVTELIVKAVHEQTRHQGRGMTLGELRANGYWIIGGSSAVERYIHNCVTCKKLRGKTEEQKMGNLPSDRLEPAPPFTYCAVDLFGPWHIKEGRKVLKRYGVLFTCMSCRAIHLETANSLDTSSFINALRRFISRRGPIRQLRSDRGTNFIGAKKELQEATKGLDDTKIHQFLLEKKCDWFKFELNVPSASHMGGSWERQIRTVRSVLSALLEDHGQQLDDESLRTLMCEAESVVNSRPLTVDTLCSPTSPEPLTPNHLLTGKSRVVLPPPTQFQQADVYSRRRWRRVQYLVNQFWSRWKKEFMLSLQQRQKWANPRRNIQVDDIVLLKDENQPRNQWPLARVDTCQTGKDGHVRKVRIRVGDSTIDAKGKRIKSPTTLERPIHKIVLLVPSEKVLKSD